MFYLFYLLERTIFYDVYQDKFKEFGILARIISSLRTGRFLSNYLKDSNFPMHTRQYGNDKNKSQLFKAIQ